MGTKIEENNGPRDLIRLLACYERLTQTLSDKLFVPSETVKGRSTNVYRKRLRWLPPAWGNYLNRLISDALEDTV